MEYIFTKNQIHYYNIHIVKIIKIQSLIRKRYWFEYYIKNIYTKNINEKIKKLYGKKKKKYIYEPTLFGDNSIENIKTLEIAFKQKQKEMKEGELGQLIIGNWYGWEDLGVGHSSGLDCRKKDNSIIMDVKNKWNTCNSGSKKALFDKLAKYKKENPSTRCIWAIVNEKPGCKQLHEKIIYNGVEIEKIQGAELFKLVFSVNNINYSSI